MDRRAPSCVSAVERRHDGVGGVVVDADLPDLGRPGAVAPARRCRRCSPRPGPPSPPRGSPPLPCRIMPPPRAVCNRGGAARRRSAAAVDRSTKSSRCARSGMSMRPRIGGMSSVGTVCGEATPPRHDGSRSGRIVPDGSQRSSGRSGDSGRGPGVRVTPSATRSSSSMINWPTRGSAPVGMTTQRAYVQRSPM